MTSRMLQHPRFVPVLPSVYRHETHELTPPDWVRAAELTLPPDAVVSHQTRFVRLGLVQGDLFPLHFTVGRDLHLPDLPRIFLHRTLRMPRCTDAGVQLATALIGTAAELPLIDVVCAGDWLLHRGLLRLDSLRRTLVLEHWRPGAPAARQAADLLRSCSRSPMESQVRCLLVAAGLPEPESNADVVDADGQFLACADLYYRWLRLLIEYEGRQHALDAAQFQRDIVRYARLRDQGYAYVQVTQAMAASPRVLVETIHRSMRAAGYDGPAPRFGSAWAAMLTAPAPWQHHPRRSRGAA